MNSYAVYRVTGRRAYRGHKPGDTFEARLDPDAERRAIQRGDIRVLERIEITLLRGSYALPKDWLPREADATTTEAPRGASFVTEGGKK